MAAVGIKCQCPELDCHRDRMRGRSFCKMHSRCHCTIERGPSKGKMCTNYITEGTDYCPEHQGCRNNKSQSTCGPRIAGMDRELDAMIAASIQSAKDEELMRETRYRWAHRSPLDVFIAAPVKDGEHDGWRYIVNGYKGAGYYLVDSVLDKSVLASMGYEDTAPLYGPVREDGTYGKRKSKSRRSKKQKKRRSPKKHRSH
jgi:hypothetical protein